MEPWFSRASACSPPPQRRKLCTCSLNLDWEVTSARTDELAKQQRMQEHPVGKGTDPMHRGFLRIYHVHKLIKFIKNYTYSSIIFYNCIKFQVQIPSCEGALKKIKFLINLELEICEKFLFLCYRQWWRAQCDDEWRRAQCDDV
jgi:hypothetical protein